MKRSESIPEVGSLADTSCPLTGAPSVQGPFRVRSFVQLGARGFLEHSQSWTPTFSMLLEGSEPHPPSRSRSMLESRRSTSDTGEGAPCLTRFVLGKFDSWLPCQAHPPRSPSPRTIPHDHPPARCGSRRRWVFGVEVGWFEGSALFRGPSVVQWI